MTVQEWLGKENKLGQDIWERKYRCDNESFDEWVERISGGNLTIAQLIVDKKFLFGGRILANRGLENKGRKISLSNCYVIEPPEDNIESIFDCAKKLARTYSYGGGCGVDISKLSPRGAKVNNAAKETTGSVSFMDLYSMVTGLIGQSGRRGALMLSLSCDHPDLEEFIGIKSDLDRVTKANISIRITDKFMVAVKNRTSFTLSFTRLETGETITKEVDAYEMFHKMCEMNWDYAEPGMLFWDRINNWNLLSCDDEFEYAGTNPCAEEPLPAGGSCLLGSINLSEFVCDTGFDFDDFKYCVKESVIALNEVLDEGLPLHPLKEQRESVYDWRQIGLGIFGLADLLIKLGIKYGSPEAIDLCDMIGHIMSDTAIKTSALKRKVMSGCGSLHIVAMFDPITGELLETYISKGSTGGCQSNLAAVSRLISLSARAGVDVYTIADQLKSCPACPSYVGRTMTKHDTSKGKCCPDAIANALIDMYKEMKNSIFSDDIEMSNVKSKVIKKNTEDKEQSVNVKNPCPVCGEELTFEGGCNVCKACGWSKCD